MGALVNSYVSSLAEEKQCVITDHFLHEIRSFELEEILPHLPAAPAKILEVGAGSGWQAHLLAKRGYDISAIDISSNPFAPAYEKIKIYDGKNFPFSDASFGTVYVSNVMDHVHDMELFSREIQRVLEAGGTWILVLPTSSWAFWNLLFYYFKMPAIILRKLLKRRVNQATGKPVPLTTKHARYIFMPGRLGERGNAVTEIALFSHAARLKFFKDNGWTVADSQPLHLFYTGVRLAGAGLSLKLRKALSFVLGSSCRVYVLKKRDTAK